MRIILKTMKPRLNTGEYVFCTLMNLTGININDALLIFKEDEGITIVIQKETADILGFSYSLVTSWITLSVHSSLDAVGLTAAFSKVLSEKGISCNVVSAYYHDHIFVRIDNAERAMHILSNLEMDENQM